MAFTLLARNYLLSEGVAEFHLGIELLCSGVESANVLVEFIVPVVGLLTKFRELAEESQSSREALPTAITSKPRSEVLLRGMKAQNHGIENGLNGVKRGTIESVYHCRV